jgi:hypothetical protein
MLVCCHCQGFREVVAGLAAYNTQPDVVAIVASALPVRKIASPPFAFVCWEGCVCGCLQTPVELFIASHYYVCMYVCVCVVFRVMSSKLPKSSQRQSPQQHSLRVPFSLPLSQRYVDAYVCLCKQ